MDCLLVDYYNGLPLAGRCRERIQWWLEQGGWLAIGEVDSARVIAEKAFESQTVHEHTQRADQLATNNPRKGLGREAMRQLSRGHGLADHPFAGINVQVAADLQRVAEDDAEPDHPAPGVALPPALAEVVVIRSPATAPLPRRP